MATGMKRLTILHSNDMHGDFLAEVRGEQGTLIGGLALLSGYLNKVREEEENVLYVISGDMVQGSIIDSEYKGVSTIEIMNFLAPDVATLGNHELDYGLAHLLFLERMANFPIVNANMYIRKYHKRLMQPYLVIQIAGINILFIGVITETVLASLKMDQDIGSFISLEEASAEVGKICNAYRNEDIDLTVLLTHIGFQLDQELAAMLDPAWGVDIIIGGHSHTVLEKPSVVNNVLITQAGVGSDQVGRFDIELDADANSIRDYRWRLIPVDSNLSEPDPELEKYIDSYKDQLDRKYGTMVCRFSRKLSHPGREEETELGNLFADVFAQRANVDVMLLGSGSIRKPELGPVVTLGDLRGIFPFDDILYKYVVTGVTLKKIFSHILRVENRCEDGECFQVNSAVRAIYSDKKAELISLTIADKAVEDDEMYTLCLQSYHFKNATKNLGVSQDDLMRNESPRVVSTSACDVLEEYLNQNQHLNRQIEGRLVYSC